MKPSIQIPWHIAKATRLAILPTIITLQTIEAFWAAWHATYRVVERSTSHG